MIGWWVQSQRGSFIVWGFLLVLTGSVWAQTDAPRTSSLEAGARLEFMDLTNMEISDVLKILSDTAEWNIIPSQDVKGKVHVFLKDIAPETALQKLLEVNGYRFRREGNTIVIMSEEDYALKFGPEIEQKIFTLTYARPMDVVPFLRGILSSKGQAVADPANNQVVIFDLPNRFELLEKLIQALDQPRETKVIPLQNARAQDLYPTLLPLMGDPANLQVDERSNQVVITDSPYHLDRLAAIIQQLDLQDITQTRVFHLHHANAETVADLIYEMLTGRRRSGGMGYGASSRGLDDGERNSQPYTATTTSRSMLQVQGEASRPSPANSLSALSERRDGNGSTSLIPSPEAKAVDTVSASPPVGSLVPQSQPSEINSRIGGPEGETDAIGLVGTVVADPRTNSVIVTHAPSVLEKVDSVIRELDVETEFHVYQFEYADFESLGLEQKLGSLLPGANDDYQIDISTRKVTFRAPNERAQHLLKLFQEWDQPSRQVYIEARILRVALDFLRNVGTTIRINDKNGSGDTDSIVDLLFPPDIASSPQGLLQFGSLASDEYTVILQALESDSRSKLLSNPKVTVLDRQEAQFQVATDQPYTEVVTDANSDITRENTRFIPVGVTLTVAPQISSNGLIQMSVQVQVSSLLGYSSNNIPIVDRSEANSIVRIQDGHTLAVGGLIVDEKIVNIKKIPLLGDIPLLNVFFRNKSNDQVQSELILFVTPKIVESGTRMVLPDQLELPPSRVNIDSSVLPPIPKEGNQFKKSVQQNARRKSRR